MAPYRILKQGYMLKEPPASKRGMRKVHNYYSYVASKGVNAGEITYYHSYNSAIRYLL